MCLWGGGGVSPIAAWGYPPLEGKFFSPKRGRFAPPPFSEKSVTQPHPTKFNSEFLIEVKHSRKQKNLTLGSLMSLVMFLLWLWPYLKYLHLVNVWWVLCIFACSKTLSAFLINPDLTKLTSDLIWGQQRNACEKDRRKTRGVGLHQFARSARPKIRMQTYSCWAKMPYMMFAGLSR